MIFNAALKFKDDSSAMGLSGSTKPIQALAEFAPASALIMPGKELV
jgi:hypothetical protein